MKRLIDQFPICGVWLINLLHDKDNQSICYMKKLVINLLHVRGSSGLPENKFGPSIYKFNTANSHVAVAISFHTCGDQFTT